MHGLGLFRDMDDRIIRQLADEISEPERLKKFNGQSLANIIWAWAHMHYNNQEKIREISKEITRKKEILNGQEISTVAWSWSILK